MNSEKIKLYSLATPNGQKVAIALEEMGLEYEPIVIDIFKGDQFSEEFVQLNPNSKIPVIVDPNGPGGEPITVMESGAILLYLAEKTGKLLNMDPRVKNESIQWLFFQMASIGPMFGQFGHFKKYAHETCPHPYPINRYKKEVVRLLNVLEKRLEGEDYLMGNDYSIVDIATFPWVNCLDRSYKARNMLDMDSFQNVNLWMERCFGRDAVKIGYRVCSTE